MLVQPNPEVSRAHPIHYEMLNKEDVENNVSSVKLTFLGLLHKEELKRTPRQILSPNVLGLNLPALYLILSISHRYTALSHSKLDFSLLRE